MKNQEGILCVIKTLGYLRNDDGKCVKEGDCGIAIKSEGIVEFNEVASSDLPIRLFILIPILTLIFNL